MSRLIVSQGPEAYFPTLKVYKRKIAAQSSPSHRQKGRKLGRNLLGSSVIARKLSRQEEQFERDTRSVVLETVEADSWSEADSLMVDRQCRSAFISSLLSYSLIFRARLFVDFPCSFLCGFTVGERSLLADRYVLCRP